FLRGDDDLAAEMLGSAMAHLAEEDEWALRARAHLALMYAEKGDDRALALAHQAVEAAAATGRADILTPLLDGVAETAVLAGDYDLAEAWTLDKLEIESSRHDDYGRCFSHQRLA